MRKPTSEVTLRFAKAEILSGDCWMQGAHRRSGKETAGASRGRRAEEYSKGKTESRAPLRSNTGIV